MISPVTEAELHAWADGRLAPARRAAVDAYLALHPAEAARLQAYRDQNVALRAEFNPVLDQPLPAGLARRGALARAGHAWHAWLGWPGRLLARHDAANDMLPGATRAAALLVLVLGSGAAGWLLRDAWSGGEAADVLADAGPLPGTASRTARVVPPVPAAAPALPAAGASLAQRAAVAHAVYTPELKHPVEVGADQQAHLVAWLSKRLGAQLRPPQLAQLGYELEGGRLLPGQSGPVAQFMYRDRDGARLTLYVSTEQTHNQDTGFRYAQQGPLSVFYWIDGKFGYALSGALPREALGKIADAVYAQLEPAN